MKDLTASTGSLFLQSPSAGVHLYLAGDHSFNNDVFAGHISEKTGMPCHGIPSSQLEELCTIESGKSLLLFLDCAAKGVHKVCNHTCFQQCLFQNQHHKAICFNIDPDTDRDEKALQRGVDGIIYAHQSIAFFDKTVHAVLNGELWYPRQILEQHLFDSEPTAFVHASAEVSPEVALTKREQEVLGLLTIGMRNSDISTTLCISPHTVKTHVYNLFRKIQVTNRYEAAQWLSDNRLDDGQPASLIGVPSKTAG